MNRIIRMSLTLFVFLLLLLYLALLLTVIVSYLKRTYLQSINPISHSNYSTIIREKEVPLDNHITAKRISHMNMPPSAIARDCSPNLLDMASTELDRLKENGPTCHSFPAACHAMLLNIEGNKQCVDCGANNPQWAAVSYGALLCLQCSGMHRSLGVQVSKVKQIKVVPCRKRL